MNEYLKNIMNSDIPIIKYDLFSKYDFINHGFTTKKGGVSKGYYSSLNLSFTRGDEKEDVLKNYHLLAEKIGEDIEKFVSSNQTHTNNIRIITGEDAGNGIVKEQSFIDVDGMLTNEKGIVLFTYYADCVPLFFADPVKRVVGMSHSGWRGTVKKIGAKTVDMMVEKFGCDRNDIITAIGPSICKDCYEVSLDVIDEFRKIFDEDRIKEISVDKGNGHFMLDLWKANEYILMDAGILKEHIENRRICTFENSDVLFSHRATNGKRGNLAGFISLR
ncbi:conserved hypothetical protein [Lachnospiraceae bacterium RM5]|nr:conserved hypothetical protein [Lachnospiraceae bacterium RM5]